MAPARRRISLQANDTEIGQDTARIRQEVDTLKELVGDQREKGIEFQIPRRTGLGDGGVVCGHRDTGLYHGLGNHGVDLAGHQGGSGLSGGQAQLSQAGLGAGAHQPEVAADLDQVRGACVEDATHLDEGVMILGGIDQVFSTGESHPGDLFEMFGRGEDILARGGEARADRRTAQVHHAQALLAFEHAPAVPAEGLGKRRHGAPHRGQHGILKLGPPHLDHICHGVLLRLERFKETDEFRFELPQSRDRGHLEGGGEGVIG